MKNTPFKLIPPHLGALVQDRRIKEAREPYRQRPSDALSKCKRQLVFHALGSEPKPMPGRAAYVFDTGHIMEWVFLGGKVPKQIAESYGIDPETTITGDIERIYGSTVSDRQKQVMVEIGGDGGMRPGHIDGILTLSDDTRVVIDIKTTNHFMFERWLHGKDFPIDYFQQVALYAHALKLEHFCVFILNKNSSAIQEFWFELMYGNYVNSFHLSSTFREKEMPRGPSVNPIELIQLHQHRNLTVETWAALQELPDRDYKLGDWQCDYCAYSQTCYWMHELISQLGQGKEPPPIMAETAVEIRSLMDDSNSKNKKLKELKKVAITEMEKRGLPKVENDLYVAERVFYDEFVEGIGTTVRRQKIDFQWKKQS